MQAETDLLLCQRSIELNAVRACMVADPAEYPWSSYRANALSEPNAIPSPHPLYLALVSAPSERLEADRALSRTALNDAPVADLRLALSQNQPIGNDHFYAEIEAITGQHRKPRCKPRKRGRPRKTPAEDSVPNLQQQELPL